jgi:sulfate/thiosulfate transport system substrate-binding protein
MMKGRATFAALLVAGALLAAGCGGGSGGSGGDKLTLVAYSTPREAYEQLIPEFQETAAGKGVSFSQSYGASGDQSRAVQNGLAADVVAFSLEPDMTKLVDAGLVAKDWNADAHKGMITNSVAVFIVRKGNPRNIRTWDDLIKPGVEVIEPNPFTSGGAKWNIMAAYGAQLKAGKTPEQATAYLLELFRHVPVQDKSAREALQTFVGGKGDVMLAYENEAINAQQKEQPVD